MTLDIKALNRLLDEIGPTVKQGAETEVSPDETVKTVGDGLQQPYGTAYNFMSSDDNIYLQRRLNTLSWEEKGWVLQKQLAAGAGSGVPLQAWQANAMAEAARMAGNTVVTKALDTSGGAALIRQDLDPMLVSLFVSIFPAWQRIHKVPANGVVHAWDQVTAYGADTSSFISELGTVVDKTGTYARQTTNIAVYGQRRGVSFKQQLAVQAGGMNWDSARLEIQNGLTQMAHDIQKTIFQGNATNSGGTASNELGLYDANAFTGLRYWFNSAVTSATTAVNFSPYLTSSADNFVTAFNNGITNVANQVGVVPNVAYLRYDELGQLSNQQLSIQRTVDTTTQFIPGVEVPAVQTSAGKLPLIAIPGDAIGTYTASTYSSKTVADLYLMNDQQLEVPYLGQPGPSVIEIPPGVSGQLTRLYIVWGMFGLAPLSLVHGVKLRANTATS